MALLVGQTTVIDDSRNITNVTNVSVSGIVTAGTYYGSGIGLTNLNSSILPNTAVSISATTPTTTINFAAGRNVVVGLRSDTNLSLTGITSIGEAVVVILNQEGTRVGELSNSLYTATWPSNIFWESGDVPTANRRTVMSKYRLFTVNGGTTWYATLEESSQGNTFVFSGYDDYGQSGQSQTLGGVFTRNWGKVPGPWTQVRVGQHHTAGIKTDNYCYTTGHNASGQLGDQSTIGRSAFQQILGRNWWKEIAVGHQHTVGIRSDGTVWGWGNNGQGQLANNSTVPRSSPIQMRGETGHRQITCAYNSTFVIDTNKDLWSWGENSHGVLGTTNTTNYSSPQRITTTAEWVSVDAAQYHVVGRKRAGNGFNLLAWGHNNHGQLGKNDTNDATSPTIIGSDKNWEGAVAGWNHTIGIQTGQLWSWGYNGHGEVGDSSTVPRSSPVRVGLSSDWYPIGFHLDANVGAAYSYGYARNVLAPKQNGTIVLKPDGTLWNWGHHAQTPVGNYVNRSSPVQITNAPSFKALAVSSHAYSWTIAGITTS